MNSRKAQKAPALAEKLLALTAVGERASCFFGTRPLLGCSCSGSTPIHIWVALTGLRRWLLLLVLLEEGGKDMKVKRMCWEGSRESEVDMIKMHCTDVWNCERINKIYT